jgi:hypothetical protein
MSNLPDKIHSATENLRNLQQEIQSPVADRERRLAEVDSATLKEFKKSVDHLRQLLWTYIQADGLSHGQNFDEEIRSLRLQHVTEMLHSIQQEAKLRQFKPNPATVLFLHAVQEIADAAFERHTSSDSGVERVS